MRAEAADFAGNCLASIAIGLGGIVDDDGGTGTGAGKGERDAAPDPRIASPNQRRASVQRRRVVTGLATAASRQTRTFDPLK